jgi:hypothetical protein
MHTHIQTSRPSDSGKRESLVYIYTYIYIYMQVQSVFSCVCVDLHVHVYAYVNVEHATKHSNHASDPALTKSCVCSGTFMYII